ncbi:Hypothetical predicted protein [Mytilus galloprovincialis]|uniref:C1q domain-containing protein n=1 Tax=Mytilus galloprovincialis TaxID=29158 RepID=A0A8B6CF62_MYTGA|nr:Hypothetical predicted protein [Mytilus galloprovincialis]
MLSKASLKYVIFGLVFNYFCRKIDANDKRLLTNNMNGTSSVDHLLQRTDQTIQNLETKVSVYDSLVLSMQNKINTLETSVNTLNSKMSSCVSLSASGPCSVNETDVTDLKTKIPNIEGIIQMLSDRLLKVEKAQVSFCPTIAFMTSLNHVLSHVQSGVKLSFDNVIFNVGNAYSAFQGNFVAPKTGIYFLTYTITSTPRSAIIIRLHRNGVDIGQISHHDHSDYLKTTESILTQLTENDDVWLETEDVHHPDRTSIVNGRHNLESHFAGVLLYCD